MGLLSLISQVIKNINRYRSAKKWAPEASSEDLLTRKSELEEELEDEGYWLTSSEKPPELQLICDELESRRIAELENDPSINRDPSFRWTDENRWDKD